MLSELPALLRALEPMLHEGVYVYACVRPDFDLRQVEPIALFREAEGLTLILAEADAERAGLLPAKAGAFRAAWLTLRVHSDLQAVGLTAAVSRVLAEAGIACNVVAAFHHDHLFVPVDRAQDALMALKTLQRKDAP